MVSFTRKFVSIGNRRDKNLADVADKEQGLTNLLKTISGEGTFIAADIDCINDLRFERTTPGILSTLSGTTVKVSQENDGVVELVTAEPLVTIKDKVENARDITGRVPSYLGGLGLDARFIKSTEINASNVNSTGADLFVFNSEQPIEKNYWEYGLFSHKNFIEPTFEDQYGGVQWTGYFSPRRNDPSPVITVYTTGLLIIEYDLNDVNSWTKLVNIYAQTRPIVATSTTSGTTINISQASNNHLDIAVGDRLAANPNITVTGVSNTAITLSSAFSVTTGQTVNITKNMGSDVTSKIFRLPLIEPGKEYVKLRISYWYPNNGADVPEKNLYYVYEGGTLTFPYLYSELPIPPGTNEIRSFLDEALAPYNTKIGDPNFGGVDYKEVVVKKTYNNVYEPKNSLTQVRTLGPLNATVTNNTSIIVFQNDASNVAIGNFVVPVSSTGNQMPKYMQIKNRMTATELVLKEKVFVNATQSVNVIDHKGFIDWFFANSVGTTITVPSTATLSKNNLVINSTSTGYIRILDITSPTTFTVSSTLGTFTNQPIYVYSESGLKDLSKLNFCQNVFGITTATLSNLGTSIVLNSNTGVQIGQVVQYGDSIPDGTTVTNITGNTVTLSASTTKVIVSNSTITFAPAGTTLNKEICVIPLNTAPPFEGTNTGLRTVNKGLKAEDTLVGNFDVVTSNLVFVTNTTNIAEISVAPQYNRKIRIKSGAPTNNNYFILASNTP